MAIPNSDRFAAFALPILSVLDWPVFWRRVFMIALPFSFPLWIGCFVLFAIGVVVLSLVELAILLWGDA